jgi:hypothetical protein
MANKALLVTYCNNMFSNWTTEPGTISMSGHEMSPEINFLYKSELEYLFFGHDTAARNLQVVALSIFGIRLIANIVSSYIISEINDEIKMIANLVTAIPFAGKVLRFLVRPFYVFCESLNDLARLRNGSKVVIVKLDKETWRFSIRSMATPSGDDDTDDDDYGIEYRDYLTVFLMTTNRDTLTRRTGRLIMLNHTTKRLGAEAVSGGAPLLDLAKANTSFIISTDTRVRFLFLSLGYAQGDTWVDTPVSRSFPVRVMDYRGY